MGLLGVGPCVERWVYTEEEDAVPWDAYRLLEERDKWSENYSAIQ